MNDEVNKINQNQNEESFVDDLKKSLENTIQETLVTLNELVKNNKITGQDNEIQDETKEIIKNFSQDFRKSLQQASDNSNNKKTSKEEE